MKHKSPRILISFPQKLALKLVKEIETPAVEFDDYLEQCHTIQPDFYK